MTWSNHFRVTLLGERVGDEPGDTEPMFRESPVELLRRIATVFVLVLWALPAHGQSSGRRP